MDNYARSEGAVGLVAAAVSLGTIEDAVVLRAVAPGALTPSAERPRLSSSRTAAARLGIRRWKRQVSSASSSSGVNMIWSRSPRVSSLDNFFRPLTLRLRRAVRPQKPRLLTRGLERLIQLRRQERQRLHIRRCRVMR